MSEQPTPTAEKIPVETPSGLLRVLGPGMAMAMVIGNVIGAGILMKPSDAATATGSFSMIISAWALGGVFCLLGALCFAELSVMLPKAGGVYVYLKEAYGSFVAFLFGWSEFMFGRPASIGALSAGIVYQWGAITERNVSLFQSVQISLGVIGGLTFINLIGVIWGGRVQGATTLVKVGFLAALALLPFALMSAGYAGIDSSNFNTTVEPVSNNFAVQFTAALVAVMWAYNGWHAVTPVAEEIRNPQRTIPLALFGGLGILIVLYLGVNCVYHAVLSMKEVQEAGIALPQVMIKKLLTPISENLARTGILIVSFAAICSMLGSMNTNVMNGPRVVFAMGRDRVFPRFFGKVHPRFHTPARAIILQSVMASLLVIASAILIQNYEYFSKRSIFDILTDYVVIVASLFLMLAVGAVVVLRIKHPEWERPYRAWGYPVIPVLYVLSSLVFIYYAALGKPKEAGIGLALSFSGVPLYLCCRWRARRDSAYKS